MTIVYTVFQFTVFSHLFYPLLFPLSLSFRLSLFSSLRVKRSNPLLNNKVASAPCVLLSELLTQWATATLLFRKASIHIWITSGLKPLVMTSFLSLSTPNITNFANLSTTFFSYWTFKSMLIFN